MKIAELGYMVKGATDMASVAGNPLKKKPSLPPAVPKQVPPTAVAPAPAPATPAKKPSFIQRVFTNPVTAAQRAAQ